MALRSIFREMVSQVKKRGKPLIQPRVSVCIPAYNHEQFLIQTVESIWNNGYPNVEIVVIDDCSTDKTYENLKLLVERSPVPLIARQNERNIGPARTLNRCTNIATGEFLVLFSSDDWFLAGRLKKQVDFLCNNQHVEIVYSNGTIGNPADESGQKIHGDEIIAILNKSSHDIYEHLLTHKNRIFLQTAMVRKSAFLAAGGFDDGMIADDWVFNIRIFRWLQSSRRHAFLDIDAFSYRLHPQQCTRNYERQFLAKFQVVEQYTPPQYQIEALTNIIGDFLLQKWHTIPRTVALRTLQMLTESYLRANRSDMAVEFQKKIAKIDPSVKN